MSLLDKLKSVGKLKSETISESSFFKAKIPVPTKIPIVNVALGGTLDSGVTSGLTVIAGESRTFKSNLALTCVSTYLNKHKDGVCLFYDSEFGTNPEYMTAHGIPTERVIHVPITNLEELKFDIVKKLDEIKKTDKVIIFVDSIGNLASLKEVNDADDAKSVADMSRAKQMKSFFRIVTPTLILRDIPLLAINHVYMEQSLYPKAILSGGTGIMLSANTVFIITRSQEKDGKELSGWNFTINIEKSRTVIEKSKLKFTVLFDGGISKYSGLLELAVESGHVKKPTIGWYSKVDTTTGEIEEKKYRAKDTNNKEFWSSVLGDKSFYDYVKNKYQLSSAIMLDDES